MTKILITGATGNIGVEVIRFLMKSKTSNKIVAGVRNIEKAKNVFKDYPGLHFVHFDFEDFNSFDKAFNGIDKVFLLRPPHLSDIETYFKPLIAKIKDKGITQLVFLSVQGAEKSKIIPHNKIERLIIENGLDYIFLRPSYFMQNLTTTLLGDIQSKREIMLPAGKAKFNWVDIENIGEAAAILLERFDEYKNQAIDLTGYENENFEMVTKLMNTIINNPIEYKNVNPFWFYRAKKQEGMTKGMIMVMILLHYLPRFQSEPSISYFYENLTGKKPTDLKTFFEREKAKFD
jgi:uncharacterized protein YbjT (DUF2867 family)